MQDPALPMSPEAPLYERVWKSFERTVTGRAGRVTEKVSSAAHEHMGFRKADAAKWIPWIGGATAGTTGMLLLEPLTRLGQATANAAKQVVTGVGILPKIPVIGGIFTLAGDAIDAVGDVSGAIFSGVAGLVTFKSLQVSPAPRSYSHGDVTGAVMPASACLLSNATSSSKYMRPPAPRARAASRWQSGAAPHDRRPRSTA